ncbi:ABC transporter substrate-binding protein [Paenibacillus kobensis]|uniref:ABC transporter substrate-binding protein n=1 Tax=Paenibacillus kobensis TaxID=59841 RepID=UPI000FD76499|nr:ABC transporter substrate-binding protein [Paenibacillus kobensis]
MARKYKLRSVLLPLLAVAMTGSLLASCSKSDEDKQLKPVTFTYFNAAPGEDLNTNETTIGSILEKETGVNFKVEYLVGDINTKVVEMIASGQYPDVIVPDAAIDKLVDAGAFIPLNDLINRYGPNIKRVYGPYFNQMKAKDGNIYFLPFSAIVGKYNPSTTVEQAAFWIQRRVLKAFNYPRIKTLDEYFDLIEQYAKTHPEPELIGFQSLTDLDRFYTLTNAAMHLGGYPNDGGIIVDMKTHKATDYGDGPLMKRWMQKLNEVNDKGLFSQSSFVDNYDQYLAKVASGHVLGFFDYQWQVTTAFKEIRNKFKESGTDDLDYMPLPIVFDKTTVDQYIDPPSFVNNRGIGITVSARDPIRIIKFFDNLLTDENQRLSNWGIEGETYSVDKDGRYYRDREQSRYVYSEPFRKSFGFSLFEYNWPRYGSGSSLADGNSVNVGRQPEIAAVSFSAGDRLILSKYGVKTFTELFADPLDRPWFPAWSIPIEPGSEAQLFTQKKSDLQRKYMPKLVLSNPEEFEGVWKQYVTEFNQLGAGVYEQHMTEEIQHKIDLVEGK